jgi:hypothetical protein
VEYDRYASEALMDAGFQGIAPDGAGVGTDCTLSVPSVATWSSGTVNQTPQGRLACDESTALGDGLMFFWTTTQERTMTILTFKEGVALAETVGAWQAYRLRSCATFCASNGQ